MSGSFYNTQEPTCPPAFTAVPPPAPPVYDQPFMPDYSFPPPVNFCVPPPGNFSVPPPIISNFNPSYSQPPLDFPANPQQSVNTSFNYLPPPEVKSQETISLPVVKDDCAKQQEEFILSCLFRKRKSDASRPRSRSPSYSERSRYTCKDF